MKFKKLISSSLALGLLINFTSISLASMLSEDGRYETFKGNNITIDNILEEDKVDVEIEGNTLVNIINYDNIAHSDYNWNYDVDKRTGYMNLTDKTDTYKGIDFNVDKEIELNKEYTLFVNVTKNTMLKYDSSENNRIAKIMLSKTFGYENTFYIDSLQTGIIKYVFRPSGNTLNLPRIEILLDAYNGEFEFKDFMIIEGNHIDKDIDFFEGMKSVGELENNKIEILSKNKNLIHLDEYVNLNEVKNGISVQKEPNGLRLNGTSFTNQEDLNIHFLPYDYTLLLEPGKIYKLHFELLEGDARSTKSSILYNYCYKYESPNGNISWNNLATSSIIDCRNNTGFAKISYIRIYSYKSEPITFNNALYQIQAEEVYENDINNEPSFIKSEYNEIEIPLTEPLRSLPNGVKDRIIKRNGQWVVERNVNTKIYDGSEDWIAQKVNDEVYRFNLYNQNTNYTHCFSNLYLFDWGDIPNKKYFRGENGHIFVYETNLNKTVEQFKEELNRNNLIILGKLSEPIYEPLNIDLSLKTYLEVTHISNNSNIPANMKIAIDRTINRAVEAIELAKTNPTVENLSKARMWSNLLKESIKKDELQGEISSITNIEDLQLERKTASANVDVYIKSENMLLMSLSTNSITFNDFSGVEDMELNNAINISINSSLPYQLNSYLLTEIENSDKSNRIEKDLLNIKSNIDNNYKTFNDINEKLILEDDCVAGNNKSHSVDLRLKGGQAHKADIYKTVIKFEAEQK